MARPKKENPKDIQYRVRLDTETAEELESLHKQSGMCKAFIIRELIHRAYWRELHPKKKRYGYYSHPVEK